MRLKIVPAKNDKVLYLVKTIRKPGAKYTTTEAIERFGLLSELKKQYEDPISYFREVAAKRTEEARALKAEQKELTPIKVDLNAHIDFASAEGSSGKYGNFIWMGQMPLLRMYHMLEIDDFLVRRRRSWGISSGMEVIYKLLCIGRVVAPSSKLATWNQMPHFRLGNSKPSDDDIYNALRFIGDSSQDMLIHLNDVIRRRFGRDTSLMYYDVTNYYCEIDDPDNVIDGGLRVRGCSKEHRPEPIIQMGLFMDTNGLPVTFGLFPGNNSDITTFLPMMEKTADDYGMKKMIYIADKAMMSHDNIVSILMNRCGYIISDSPRKKQSEDLMDFILDGSGYIPSAGGDFKCKSRMVPIHRSGIAYRGEGDKKTCTVNYNEIQIVFWSRKYQERARALRNEAIEKAIKNPKVFDDYNVKAFLDKIPYDSKTGEVHGDDLEYLVAINREKLEAAERLDGYYIIRTNVIGTEPGEREWEGECRFRNDNLFQLNKHIDELAIIDMYRGLWEIEETFKITKSFLSARPVYVRKESSIKAHFMTCFIALLMVRLLEKQAKGRLNHSEVIDALQESMIAEVHPGVYRNIITSKAMDILGKSVNLDLTKVWYSANEVRSLAAKPK